MTGHCTRHISSAREDEETYECGRHATVEALTTSGQWEPHCAVHVQGWPSDRVRAPVTADVQRELAAITDAVRGTEMYYEVADRVRTVQALIADAENRAAAAALEDLAADLSRCEDAPTDAALEGLGFTIRTLHARAAALDPAGPDGGETTHVHGAWCHPSAEGCPDDLR